MGIEQDGREVIFRDIRRYYCECRGICRSKKSLISSHILLQHKEEIKEKEQKEEIMEGKKMNTCEECGACFKKPAHLKQHVQSHSLERPFTCPVDDCHSCYRRKDHLARHLLQHQGKLFECPVEDCKRLFAFQGNVKRHVKVKLHVKKNHCESSSVNAERSKKYICQEIGCGKSFKYPSKLLKHEDSHIKLDTVEALCSEPGCMKYFTNKHCLKEHLLCCHQYIACEICGTKQLKKNIKRHLRTHEVGVSSERIKCSFDGCVHTFSNRSNLKRHIEAVHLDLKPFTCGIPGCGMKFAFKHVRDNHEKSGCHVYTQGNFEDSDEQFRLRSRGGRKRKYPVIETLLRKRVIPPSESDPVMRESPEYLSWLLNAESED